MNRFRILALAGMACLLSVSACGDSDESDAPAGSAVNRELAEEGIDFDASTMDAMSVDVVAGGSPAEADPRTADAGIDMLEGGAETAPSEATESAGDAQNEQN